MGMLQKKNSRKNYSKSYFKRKSILNVIQMSYNCLPLPVWTNPITINAGSSITKKEQFIMYGGHVKHFKCIGKKYIKIFMEF